MVDTSVATAAHKPPTKMADTGVTTMSFPTTADVRMVAIPTTTMLTVNVAEAIPTNRVTAPGTTVTTVS
jgi:hypothetical protein